MTAPDPVVEVRIESLGAGGDGIAQTPEGRIFVPFTVPGDLVRVRIGAKRGEGREAMVEARLEDGRGRVTAPCPHFGDCGGCAAQHMAQGLYAGWKRDLVIEALGRRGIDDPPVLPLAELPPGGRRRAELAAARTPSGIALGFHARRAERVCDLASCLVLRPRLVALLPALRRTLDMALSKRGAADLLLTDTSAGVDLVVTTPSLDTGARAAFARLAEAEDLARVSFRTRPDVQAEPVALRRTPSVALAGVEVAPPPGAFLQASAEAEARLTSEVVDGVGNARHVADLYAGCGTFTFALARTAKNVQAAESDAAQVSALRSAAANSSLSGRIAAEIRDLDRRPLLTADLAAYDAVVFDPPRAGAARQAEQLARSRVPKVVAVSCAPASFARDARTLVDGGYRLIRVQPIDQFVWSASVELVALFER